MIHTYIYIIYKIGLCVYFLSGIALLTLILHSYLKITGNRHIALQIALKIKILYTCLEGA